MDCLLSTANLDPIKKSSDASKIIIQSKPQGELLKFPL